MKPKILLLIRERFKSDLLPDWIVDHLNTFADTRIVVEPNGLSEKEYAGLFKGIDGLISSWEIPPIGNEAMQNADRLRIISHAGGQVRFFLPEEVFDSLPQVVICNASNVMARPVAEHTLMSALACLRSVWFFREWTAQGENWETYEKEHNRSLLHRKVGVVGLGQIGGEFIELARPFKVQFMVYSKHLSGEDARAKGLTKASLEEIFSTCDVIAMSAANTKENYHMIHRGLLKMIKPGAVFINNARGALVDEQALIEELETGRFMASIDVTDPEPPAADSKLRRLPNVMLTPHIGGPTPDQWPWMTQEAVNILEAYFSGKPVWNIIDRRRYQFMA
jgi:phosphoglycerate dehydrogenase-like enzyme